MRRPSDQVLALVDDVGDLVLGIERLDAPEELGNADRNGGHVQRRDAEPQPEQIVLVEAGAEQEKRQQEDVGAQADELHQRRITGEQEEQQNRPGDERDDPETEIVGLAAQLRRPRTP